MEPKTPIPEGIIETKTWAEFRDCKLLWWVNRTIQLFGWVIIVEQNDEGVVIGAHPARWFDQEFEGEAYKVLTEHIAANRDRLLDDVKE